MVTSPTLLVTTPRLPMAFPFRVEMQDFLRRYGKTSAYWYVPKARTLTDENIVAVYEVLRILEKEFLDRPWNGEAQHDLLVRLIAAGVVDPVVENAKKNDANALMRIWKIFLQFLGLVWLDDKTEQIVLTPAASGIIAENQPMVGRKIIEMQLAKYQYPNPGLNAEYSTEFTGLLPLLFLLQILQRTDYHLTKTELCLFLNLARSHDDVDLVARYIRAWRDLTHEERDTVHELAKRISVPGANASRARRVSLNSSYQMAAFSYPQYVTLGQTDGEQAIFCIAKETLDEIVATRISDLKVTSFTSMEEWISYYGDPDQKPDWSTYLLNAVDKAESEAEAKRIVGQAKRVHGRHVTSEVLREVEIKQLEKGIEDFYEKRLHLIEPGLILVEHGRQYQTPIGRMDLLCWGSDETYVIVEIKVDAAEDAVFGQVLRYMGWIHRTLEDGENKVRSIIVAGDFPERARYSRIGLMRDDYKRHIGFFKHGFAGSVV